jgi:hypothetical protein
MIQPISTVKRTKATNPPISGQNIGETLSEEARPASRWCYAWSAPSVSLVLRVKRVLLVGRREGPRHL